MKTKIAIFEVRAMRVNYFDWPIRHYFYIFNN